jgi:alpha-L-fucosidase
MLECIYSPRTRDWYARNMYIEGSKAYNYHCKNYGHPSEFGYKDIVDLWKGENFNPQEQIKLFEEIGARYFVAMANHHDNFDLWDSRLSEMELCQLWSQA